MQITIRLLTSILIVMTLVASGFAYYQARQEDWRLTHDIQNRAGAISENIREEAQRYLEASLTDALTQIAGKYTRRERLSGVFFHDVQGNMIAESSAIEPTDEDTRKLFPINIQEVERQAAEFGRFVNIHDSRLYAHSYPVLIEDKPAFVITVLQDAEYISVRIKRIWVTGFLRVLVQALFISLALLATIYLSVMTPIHKTTEWIRKIRRGETTNHLDMRHQKLLGGLAKEISKMAKSLQTARLSAEEEARLRVSAESMWTPDRLKEFVRLKLQDRPLFVVSNREPYMHLKKGKEIECIVPASGLVTAIEPVLKACGGTWIAQGSGDADRQTVDKNDRLRVPPEEPQYTLRRVWVSREDEEGFYYGFSNEGLWPLCHIAHTRPIFREKDFEAYVRVNQQFADAVCEELEGTTDPCVLIQDYHFALLPQLLKRRRPDAKVAIFWHIPWPNPESFGICPWQRELLQGMLGADLIGFHTQYHCNNFIETVDRVLESRIDYEHFTVNRERQTTWIKPFPISISFLGGDQQQSMSTPKKTPQELLRPYGLEAEIIAVGVDRLDYTKGILERFWSIERFLDKNPSYQGKFTFVELGAPSRTEIKKYKDFMTEVDSEVDRINNRFKTKKNWKPILFLKKHHSHKDIQPFYQTAEMCLVTSLHDGMNLVAKEYVAAKNGDAGTLILSQFTGAARELTDAIVVNPYDIVQTAEAIKIALNMSDEEKLERMRRMRDHLKERNIYKWAADLVNDLSQIRYPVLTPANLPANP